jgi:predicted nuclease with TOPRIM domain
MFGRKWKQLQNHLHGLQSEVTALREDLQRRGTEITAMNDRLRTVDEQLSQLDLRLTGMSTAITNQLHELDTEIERLGAVADTASAEAVSELRSNQVRIANEQARYAIALRQDLAELAEVLRRLRA